MVLYFICTKIESPSPKDTQKIKMWKVYDNNDEAHLSF